MIGHIVHHFSTRVREPLVVFKKIAVAINVGHYQLLVNRMVAPHQVSVTRVIVNDHFINFGEPVIIPFFESFIRHAEGPVRIAGRKSPVGGDFVEVLAFNDFENRFVEIKSVTAIEPIHEAQLLTYMKLGQWRLGLLINFNVAVLALGVRRLII